MASSKEKSGSGAKESAAEKGARIYRNLNVLGALALGGAAVILPPAAATAAAALAAIDVAQAAGAEGVRRYAKKRRKK